MSNIDQTGSLTPQSQLQGRYSIIATVGEGGMSFVYKAIDRQYKNRLVAIKEMSLSHYQSPAKRRKAEELFHREAEILSHLSHPHLPQVYDFFNENGRSYLVMEFIKGKTLGQLLTESTTPWLPTEKVLDYAFQLCDALSYLHQQTPPIIFRDLKPANVIVTTQGRVYLIDFGIARIFKQGLDHDTQNFGTPGFASPEHYGKGQTGPWSDLYSLGATLHYCLTGKDPRSNTPTLFDFLPAYHHNPQVPLDLSNLIQRLVATKGDQRPPDAKTVQHELLSIQKQLSNPTASSTASPKASLASLMTWIIGYPNLNESPGTRWTSTTVPWMANVYSRFCTWFLLAIVARSQQLYRKGIHASSTWTSTFWQSLSSKDARWPIRAVWTRQFLFFFSLSAIGMIGCSLYMLILLHYPVHLVAFYLCTFALLQFSIAFTNQRIHHPLAHSILTTMTLFLTFIAVALFTSPEIQPIIETITFNQLLSLGMVILIAVSLLRPKRRLGWVDHACLATVAATYALLLIGVGTQVLGKMLFPHNDSHSMQIILLPIDYLFILILLSISILELYHLKGPFTIIDRLALFIVALIATPLQLFYGLQEIPHLSIFMIHIESIIKTSSDSIFFNTLLTGIPVITALLWLFIAPSTSYLGRLPLLPLALACLALQSFLGPAANFPLLKSSPHLLASSVDSMIHINQLITFGLALISGILLYRRQHTFKGFEQFSLFYVAITSALLQNAAWNIGNLPFLTSVHSQSAQATSTEELQLYLLAINKLLAQMLILFTTPVLVITISGMFLYLAREFTWVDEQLMKLKQRFNWLDQLVLRLNHLILLVTSVTNIFLLWLRNNDDILQLNPIFSSKTLSQLVIVSLLIGSVVALTRISHLFGNIDRWLIFINVIACIVLFLSGHVQQTSVKPWLTDPHIILPPEAIAFGLLLTTLVSLMWLKRRIPQTHRSMLTIGFGLTLVCTILQWLAPIFLLTALILLTLSVLLATQIEQV
jgi:serine/threonine protein kinase